MKKTIPHYFGNAALHKDLLSPNADISKMNPTQLADYLGFNGERIKEVTNPTEEQALFALMDNVENIKHFTLRTREIINYVMEKAKDKPELLDYLDNNNL